MLRTLLALIVLALAVPTLVFANDKVTICHAAGLDGTTKYVTLTIARPAVYGPAGHFYENGTPRAGHEEDYLGACKSQVSPTPSMSVAPTPTMTAVPSTSPTPSVEPTPLATPTPTPTPGATSTTEQTVPTAEEYTIPDTAMEKTTGTAVITVKRGD